MTNVGYSIPDSHLQAPIRPTLRKIFTDCNVKPPDHIDVLRRTCHVSYPLLDIKSEGLYGTFLSDIYNTNIPIPPWINEQLPAVNSHVHKFIRNHTVKLFAGDNSLYKKEVPVSKELKIAYAVKCYWETIRVVMQQLKDNKDTKWRSHSVINKDIKSLHLCQSFIIVQDHMEHYYLLDYDQVMMISDTVSSRFFVMWYFASLKDEFNSIDINTLFEIYKVYDRCIMKRGNKAYNEIKMWEPIIQGMLLLRYDELNYSNKFIKTILMEIDTENHIYALEMFKLLKSTNLNPYQLGELHGLYRHWGHPTVNEPAGCAKVRKIAKKRGLPNFKTITKMKALFIRQFCISFITMHSRWPKINTKGLKNKNPLKKLITENHMHVNFFSPRYSLDHWAEIEFQQEFSFDYHLDFTDICDDKAISVDKDHLSSIYNPQMLGYVPLKSKSSRRVLIEILQKTDLDIKEICKLIMNRSIPDAWKIILLHAKERELKIEPRLFAMMVLEMRIYFCITESNLSDTIFKYFPQQTMTLSEADLTKRLYSISSDADEAYYCPVYASIDFKSWNIHWTYLTTEMIFEIIDKLFGTPGLYTFSHEFFQSCLIALASYYDPPDSVKGKQPRRGENPEDCETLWYEHCGGFEGLRQKGWTLVTICLLLLVEYETGIKSFIIGQGDNQICKLMIPKLDPTLSSKEHIRLHQKYMTEKIELFLNTLTKLAKDIQLVVKTEESWVSSNIINYGKDILYNGAYLPQGAKRISRTFPDINEIFPVLLSKISTLQTTGLSTAQKSNNVFVPMHICMFEIILTIARDMHHSILTGKGIEEKYQRWAVSNDGMNFILHGDSNLFNLPVANPYSYAYRGHPDPLTTYLSFLFDNVDHCKYCSSIYVMCERKLFVKGPGEALLLVSDPLSLNVQRPRQISHMMRTFVHDALISETKNHNLKQIFHKRSQKEDEETCKYLISSDPCFPRVEHELMRLTPTGTRLNVISKFSNTRTIFTITNRRLSRKFLSNVKLTEHTNIHHWIKMSEIVSHNTIYKPNKTCPTKIAQNLRNWSWSDVIDNKEIQGVTVPHPLHQFNPTLSTADRHDQCNTNTPYILIELLKDNLQYDGILTRGTTIPYIGSRTREKQTGKIFQIPEVSRPLNAAQRIIQISQWCISPFSPMYSFVRSLASTHTNLPIQFLEMASGTVYSGSMMHRLNDHITKKQALLGNRPNISSNIYISSDEMGKYSKGSENVNLHFQGVLLGGIFIMHNLCTFNQKLEKGFSVHMHYSCNDCEEYLNDTKMINNNPPPIINVYKENPLLYTKVSNIPNNIQPENELYTLTSRVNSAEAAASIIFSRIIKNIQCMTWGVTERSGTIVSPISIQDVIKININNIISTLAIYLYLHFLHTIDKTFLYISSIEHIVWRDVSHICLFPEILKDLYYASGEQCQSSLYDSTKGVERLLTRSLYLSINRLKKLYEDNEFVTFPTIFLLPNINMGRAYQLWAKHIYLISNEDIDLRKVCRKVDTDNLKGLYLPSNESMQDLYVYIRDNLSIDQQKICLVDHKLRISSIPPEAVLGDKVIKIGQLKYGIKSAPQTLKTISYFISGFPTIKEIPLHTRKLVEFETYNITKSINIPIEKTYQDHQYGLFGMLSSSFLKIAQILWTFKFVIRDDIICLADGDGSISKFLYKLYNKKIYFNTLINTLNLPPQRATSYTPSEFIDTPNMVIGGSLSALLGGDLTDDKYLSEFLKILPDKASLMTMDAESEKPFLASQVINLIISSLKVAFTSKCQHSILKIYLTNTSLCQLVLGMINTIYKQIFISVPVYSSNETQEIYLICTDFDPIVEMNQIGHLVTNYFETYHPTLHHIRLERITTQPHQSSTRLWIDILKNVHSMGYKFNVDYYLERLIDFTFVYTNDMSIEQWISRSTSQLKHYLHTEMISIVKSCTSKKLNVQEQLAMCSHYSTHIPLENICISLFNLGILDEILKEDNTNDVLSIIKKHITDGYTVRVKQQVVYQLNFSHQPYRTIYLKSLWRVWGYKKYHKVISD